jgi:threonylcarbamoyladenosine tRNA methylthiotransferase MtaB
MMRRHLTRDARSVIDRARLARPGIAIGADLIAGFPTETDALFQETLDFVEANALPFLHVFPYSERPGTPAARMPSVPKPVRKQRAARLREAGLAASRAFFAGQRNSIVSILTESGQTGHTEHFAPVRLTSETVAGRVLAGRVIGTSGDCLLAEAA